MRIALGGRCGSEVGAVKKGLLGMIIAVAILLGSCGPRDSFDRYCGQFLDAKERIEATGGDFDSFVDGGEALLGLARMNEGEDANKATRIAAQLVGIIPSNIDSSNQSEHLDALARACRSA
jgi:hypothetical protein